MREGLQPLGPTEFFSGAMAAVLTRPIKEIKCLTACTFTKLNMRWPAATPTIPVDPAAPSGLTFPPMYQIDYVAGFRLLTGQVQVTYEGAPPPA